MYIAWIKCPNCKESKIEDPDRITIYKSEDVEQLCLISCPNCEAVVEESLDQATITFFESLDCNIKEFGEQFQPLTDELIDEFVLNMEKELEQFGL